MPALSDWTEWHLTPQGWQRGTIKTAILASIIVRRPPADRVLSCRFYQRRGDAGCAPAQWTNEVWKDADPAQVESLVQQYGSCPHEL